MGVGSEASASSAPINLFLPFPHESSHEYLTEILEKNAAPDTHTSSLRQLQYIPDRAYVLMPAICRWTIEHSTLYAQWLGDSLLPVSHLLGVSLLFVQL